MKPSTILIVSIATSVIGAGPFSTSTLQTVQNEFVVAADGSARYKSVQEAITAAPTATSANPVVIRVKPGIYKELIYVFLAGRSRFSNAVMSIA